MAIAAINNKVKKKDGRRSFFDGIMRLDLKPSGKISSKELSFFTNQLSLMVEIGTPLNVSLSTIAAQLKNPAFKQVVKGVTTDVEGGRLLSVALARYPRVFSDEYVSLVKAGENSGELRIMLDRLVELMEKEEKFKDMIKKAMTYPAVLGIVSFAVVVFLLTYLFPKFEALFEGIYDILPVTTKVLLFISDLIRSYWYIGAVLLVLSGWAANMFIRSDTGKRVIDRLKMNLPFLGNLFIRIYLVQMMRTLGYLMGSKITLMDAIAIARSGARNIFFAKFIDGIADNVEAGKGFALAFTQSSFIPDSAKQIIKTGEETQNIPRVMLRLSDHYEEEVDKQMKRSAVIMEPALLVIMGAIVGLIVMSLILPIFKLSRAVY